MNFLQSDLNKVSKYTIRLRKSIKNNDKDKVKEYYDHFKYHIQLGGLDQQDLENKFQLIETLIENLADNKKGYKSFDELYKELSQCNLDKKDFKQQNDDLLKQITDLNQQLVKSTESVEQINTIKQKEDELTTLNQQITQLNKTIIDLKEESDKIKSLDETKDEKLKNLNAIIKEIFKKEELTSDELDTQTKQVVSKIDRYDEIIKKIKEQIKDIDDSDNSKFSSALEQLVSRLQQSKDLEIDLTNAKNQINELNTKLEDINKTSTELNDAQTKIASLNDDIKQKDIKIQELSDKIEALNKEKESNDNEINKFADNFEKKLKSLLKQIYGSDELVDSIIQGNVFNENLIK